MTKSTKQKAIIASAASFVATKVSRDLLFAWRAGKCFDDLIHLRQDKCHDGRLATDKSFQLLYKGVRKHTGETYTKSSWDQWHLVYQWVSYKQIRKLMKCHVSCGETRYAMTALKAKERIETWVNKVANGKINRSYYTNRKYKRDLKAILARASGQVHADSMDEYLLKFEIRGGESEEDFGNMIAALLSVIVRCGYDYEAMVKEAYCRLGNGKG